MGLSFGSEFCRSKTDCRDGFSQGGNTALSLVQQRDFELFEYERDRQFKAAIAFYPNCGSDGTMTVATLILIGELLDDWTPAFACKSMMAARSGAGRRGTRVVPNLTFCDTDIGRIYHDFSTSSVETYDS